jgi:hypothetical protein
MLGVDVLFRRLFLFICAAAALPGSALATTIYAPPLPVRSGVIAARIESDREVYNAGEPIKLRLTLSNRTGSTIFYVNAASYELSDLHIISGKGDRVSPTGARGPCICEGRTIATPLAPGKSVIVQSYVRRSGNWEFREWADIRNWGYNLTTPGTYSISVTAHVNAVGTTGSEFSTSSGGSANILHITILK